MFSCGFVVMMAKKPQRSETMAEKTKGSKLSSMSFLNAMNADRNISIATPIKEKPAYRKVVFHLFIFCRFWITTAKILGQIL